MRMQYSQYFQRISPYITENVTFTILAIIISGVLNAILKHIIRTFRKNLIKYHVLPEPLIGKTSTVNSLLFSIIDVSFFVITLLIILSKWSVNITPILTGAGIAGLAVTFGAQTLIKDILAGLFIFSENQYNVGDRIRINKDQFEGKVVRLTPRITVLKDDKENKVFIPNSTITSVTLVVNRDPTPEEKSEEKEIKPKQKNNFAKFTSKRKRS